MIDEKVYDYDIDDFGDGDYISRAEYQCSFLECEVHTAYTIIKMKIVMLENLHRRTYCICENPDGD